MQKSTGIYTSSGWYHPVKCSDKKKLWIFQKFQRFWFRVEIKSEMEIKNPEFLGTWIIWPKGVYLQDIQKNPTYSPPEHHMHCELWERLRLTSIYFNTDNFYLYLSWQSPNCFSNCFSKMDGASSVNFCFGDRGYELTSEYCLIPYRGELAIGDQRPPNNEELFNLRHFSLRNLIEQIFRNLDR